MTDDTETGNGFPTDMAAGGSGAAELAKNVHPVRGVLWGIPFGLGLTLILVTLGLIDLDLIQMVITVIVGIGLGTAWSIFGPAKKPKT